MATTARRKVVERSNRRSRVRLIEPDNSRADTPDLNPTGSPQFAFQSKIWPSRENYLCRGRRSCRHKLSTARKRRSCSTNILRNFVITDTAEELYDIKDGTPKFSPPPALIRYNGEKTPFLCTSNTCCFLAKP